jgi:protein-L-isoaspartate O-methyltransferase
MKRATTIVIQRGGLFIALSSVLTSVIPKPQDLPDLMAHKDQPIREGHIHLSAPHIYAYVLEAMDLAPSSSMSFLNIGSGTGYLSCIVAQILGPTSVCYGVDIQKDAIDHCLSSIHRYKAANPDLDLPHMEFVHGNGMNIDPSVGESGVGFDRIYVGASVERGALNQLVGLLRPGGIFVGPGMYQQHCSSSII